VANAFISPFDKQTIHFKSFYIQQHCDVSLNTLYPGGIRTRVFSTNAVVLLASTPQDFQFSKIAVAWIANNFIIIKDFKCF
jgi:hypothetical protein